MPGIDKPTGRVLALIVLLMVGAAALRGYLPDVGRRARHPPEHPGSAFAMAALLSVTVAILAVSLIVRLRERRTLLPRGSAELAEGAVGAGGRPSWRVVLIGLGVLLAWLLIVVLLVRWGAPHGFGPPERSPQAPTGAPVGEPAPPTAATPPPQPRSPRQPPSGDMLGYLAASAVGMLVLLTAAAAVSGRRRRRRRPAPPIQRGRRGPEVPAGGAESLARAAEAGLAEIGDLARGPREAIIACYATMERELARVPDAVPLDCDTPSEVLARAVDHHAVHADSAAQLVRLFTEARFSPHVMDEGHREAAVRVLRLVLTELPRGAP